MGADVPGAALRAVVAVNEDPWGHRRTREIVAALERLTWEVLVVSPVPVVERENQQHVGIGCDWLARVLGRAFGPVSRNVTRAAFTLVTLLPPKVVRPLLSWVACRTLRLRGLIRVMHERRDVVVVEDVLLLPVVVQHRGEAKVVFDAREFFPRQFEHSVWWRWIVGSGMSRMLRVVLPDCDMITTVSEGLRDGYRALFDVDAHVVLNVPPRTQRLAEQSDDCHSQGLNRRAEPLRLVFHGLANPNRGLGALIDVGRALHGQANLDLYLTGPANHRRRLARAAAETTNVRVLDPVDFDEVPTMLAAYDAGIVFYDGGTFNLRHSMPSKFFEYLQAGLPVAIGPSPDMAAVLLRYDCGIVAEAFTPESLARALVATSQTRFVELRQNALAAAAELCAEVEYGRLETLMAGLMCGGREEA
jgi:glycosyltransferase involved in cell wall biosynthesis